MYLAEDTELYRKVAIKSIKPELLENEEVQKRIEYECRMHAAIQSHPHIVTLYDRIVDEPNILLIMEYVKGVTLASLIRNAQDKKSPLPLSTVITILCQILDALQTIHKHGIIHRDIKPSNILVDQTVPDNPQAKLMDFGIAKNAEGYEQLTMLTQIDTGGPGTPAYMAPERIDAATFGAICPATDLYSVGIIFYELLCLKPPFHGTMTEIFAGQLARQPDLNQLKSFPEGIQKIICKALAKKPVKRYTSGESFVFALQNFLNPDNSTENAASGSPQEPRDKTMLSTGTSESQTKALQQTRPRQHRFPAPAIIGTVAILLAIVFVILQTVPELRPWKKQVNSNQQAQKSNNISPVHNNIDKVTIASTQKKSFNLGQPTQKQTTNKTALTHTLSGTPKQNQKTTDDTPATEKKENQTNLEKQSAALEALEQEKQKKRERERIKLEEERKKRMKEQIAKRQTQQPTTKPKAQKRTRRYTQAAKKPKSTYIVIPGQ